MDYSELKTAFENNRDLEKGQQMSAYMRNLFSFLGIPTPRRKALAKNHLNKMKRDKQVDWSFVQTCWDQAYREYQYVAMDYLLLMRKELKPEDLPRLKRLILSKSWWDSIDVLHKLVGEIAIRYPEVSRLILEWSTDENIWLRRIAIDHQLSRKEKTDTELLEKIIVNNLGQTEFFINKAIGWSLREYSKTDPTWVKDFIERHRSQLALLSVREGSKYLTQ